MTINNSLANYVKFSFEIYSSGGTKIKEGKLIDEVTEIDFQQFHSGLYFIHLTDDIGVKKIIKSVKIK